MRKNSHDDMRPAFESLCMPTRPPPSGVLQCSSMRTPPVVPVQTPASQPRRSTEYESARLAVGSSTTRSDSYSSGFERIGAALGWDVDFVTPCKLGHGDAAHPTRSRPRGMLSR